VTPNNYKIIHSFTLPASTFATAWLDAQICTNKGDSTVTSCVLLEFGPDGSGAAIATAMDLLYVQHFKMGHDIEDPTYAGYIPDAEGTLSKLARSVRRSPQYVTIDVCEHKKDADQSHLIVVRSTSGESVTTHVSPVQPANWRAMFRYIEAAPTAAVPDMASYPTVPMMKLTKTTGAAHVSLQPVSTTAAYELLGEEGQHLASGVIMATTKRTAPASVEGLSVGLMADIEDYLTSVAPTQPELTDADPEDNVIAFPGGIDPAAGDALSIDDLMAKEPGLDDGPENPEDEPKP
jgi:hypothetical protein